MRVQLLYNFHDRYVNFEKTRELIYGLYKYSYRSRFYFDVSQCNKSNILRGVSSARTCNYYEINDSINRNIFLKKLVFLF